MLPNRQWSQAEDVQLSAAQLFRSEIEKNYSAIGGLPQSVQISSAEAELQLTNASPTVAAAPNSTGTATQILHILYLN